MSRTPAKRSPNGPLRWILMLVGVVVAYGLDSRLSIGTQVAAHSAVILGPSLLKIGYVMRLLAQHLQRKAGWERCCASA